MDEGRRADSLVALSQRGSDRYIGLETFDNPGVTRVELTSDELTALRQKARGGITIAATA